MKISQRILVFCLFIQAIVSQVAPTWMTSSYLQAGSKKIIDGDLCSCKTGNSSTPNAIITFVTSFSSSPNLGFGISNYQPDDLLIQEMFEVNRTNLSPSSFSVLVQIYGITNIWVMEIRYVAISKLFPHHLNSFDNVPINYTKGPLVNISQDKSTLRSYQNIVNYTTQAASINSNYRYFSLPLSNNRVLIFMTSMYLYSSRTGSFVELKVTANPWSTDTYRLYATIKQTAYLVRLHFSMITFDQIDVQNSGQYLLVYDRIQFPTSGGFYNFQVQFLANFMVGFTEFSSDSSKNSLHFIINFLTVNGIHRLQMPASVTRTGKPPINRFNFMIFYLKTWVCPTNTIFNPSTDMCISCPLSNCLTCFNTTTCTLCNTTNFYYLNSTGLCQTCLIPGCLLCSGLTTCSDCDENLNYVINSQTCQLCNHSLNQFADASSQTCIICSLSNCINCFSLTACLECNSANAYFVGMNGTCEYCDPVLNKFIDPTSKECLACPIANCTQCSSFSACLICNSGFLLNINNNLCQVCSLIGCYECQTLSVCNRCLLHYYLGPGNMCQACTMNGCNNCTDVSVCLQCDEINRYLLTGSTCIQCSTGTFPNTFTSTCQPCSLSYCLACGTLTTCITCDTSMNYYLLPVGICGYCNSSQDSFINSTTFNCQKCSLSNCLDCSSLNLCNQCNSSANYFLNITDNLCYSCSLNNCLICSDLNTCTYCELGYFVNAGQCQICNLPGCINCTGLLTCVQCDERTNYIIVSGNDTCQLCAAGLFANSSTNICQSCNILGCILCQTLTTCLTCNLNNSFYPQQGGTCGYCNSSSNYFINLTSITCQQCTISNCIQCMSLEECSSCNGVNKYLLNSTDKLCYLCTIPNCLICSTFTTCFLCNSTAQYFVNATTGLCQLCSLSHCLNCSSLTSCYDCDLSNNFGLDFTSNPSLSLCGPCNVSCVCDGYGLPWDNLNNACTPRCGDGLLRGNQQCDDGNTLSSDGCSSSCKIQKMYTCIGEPSFCYYYFYIHGSFITASRAGCNIVKVTVSIPEFTFQQINQNIYIYYPQGLTIVSRKKNNQYIDLYIQYSRDLINQTINIDFVPGQTISFTYTSLIPPIYYDQKQCEGTSTTQKLLKATQAISYGVLIFSLFSWKIVGLELFGVLQLSYFTLSSHDFLNVYLAPLANFRTFNGLNIFISSETSMLPQNIKKMQVSGSFINNCNLMLFVLFGELMISCVLYIIARVTLNQKLKIVAKNLLKQGFITIVLFNVFNVSFSAGIHSKYANSKDYGFIVSSLFMVLTLAAMIISVFAMEVTNKNGYGQFKNKFKKSWSCQIYIPLTIIYRMALGFYTAVRSDYNQGTIIILAFAFAFVMYFFINLPFKDFYQNYRAGIHHITTLVILLVTNYYRTMKSTTPLDIKAKMHTPAIIQLSLIITCLTLSILVLIYEFYVFIRNLCKIKKSPDPIIPQNIANETQIQNPQNNNETFQIIQ